MIHVLSLTSRWFMVPYSNLKDRFLFLTLMGDRPIDVITLMTKLADYKNPGSADVGLMGVLPGITGTIMANEVIKIITGIGLVLSGKLLIFNILNYYFPHY